MRISKLILPLITLLLTFGTASADLNLNSQKITNVTDPASAQDAATKNYVDSVVSGGTSLIPPAYGDTIYKLIPELRTSTKIRFYPGGVVVQDNLGNLDLAEFPSTVDVDCATNGALGLDTGTLATNTRYYWYALKATTGQTTIVCSKEIAISLVTMPTSPVNYTGAKYSKLPMGLPYKPTYGFPDFRIEAWNSKFPKFRYDDIDRAGWNFLTGGTATTFTSVNLYTGSTTWVPENSREVTVRYCFRSTTGSGNLLFKLDAGSAYDQKVAEVNVGGVTCGEYDIIITSAGAFKYQVPAGTSVDMWVVKFLMSEG